MSNDIFPLRSVSVAALVWSKFFDDTLHQSVLAESQSDTYLLSLLSFSCAVPSAPVMTIVPFKTSLSVTVVKVPGFYAVGLYCIAVVEKTDKRCSHDVSARNFYGLSVYTNYTVQGWIVNGNNLVGAKTSQIISTLTDSKAFVTLIGP